HLRLGPAQPPQHAVEAGPGQDPGDPRAGGAPGVGALRQVAELPAHPDAASLAGSVPESTLVSVVFPAPLRPTRPIRSPSPTRKETSLMSSRAPTRMARSWTVSTRARSWFCGRPAAGARRARRPGPGPGRGRGYGRTGVEQHRMCPRGARNHSEPALTMQGEPVAVGGRWSRPGGAA